MLQIFTRHLYSFLYVIKILKNVRTDDMNISHHPKEHWWDVKVAVKYAALTFWRFVSAEGSVNQTLDVWQKSSSNQSCRPSPQNPSCSFFPHFLSSRSLSNFDSRWTRVRVDALGKKNAACSEADLTNFNSAACWNWKSISSYSCGHSAPVCHYWAQPHAKASLNVINGLKRS